MIDDRISNHMGELSPVSIDPGTKFIEIASTDIIGDVVKRTNTNRIVERDADDSRIGVVGFGWVLSENKMITGRTDVSKPSDIDEYRIDIFA